MAKENIPVPKYIALFTEETKAAILDSIANRGSSYEVAASAHGISEGIFKMWLQTGMSAEESGDDENPYAMFLEQLRVAYNQAEHNFTGILTQNAVGYERVTKEIIDEIAYEEEQWQDANGRWHKKRTPVIIKKEKTISTIDRDTKIPMDWLSRRRKGWSSKTRVEFTGLDGGAIKFEEPPSAALLQSLNSRIQDQVHRIAARLVNDEGERVSIQEYIIKPSMENLSTTEIAPIMPLLESQEQDIGDTNPQT